MEEFNFNQYDLEAKGTAKYNKAFTLLYPSLLLTGEAGELANKVQKIMRDKISTNALNNPILENALNVLEKEMELILKDEILKDGILQECGDILWSLSNIAQDLGSNLKDVAVMNNLKLKSRVKRNVIAGNGDYR